MKNQTFGQPRNNDPHVILEQHTPQFSYRTPDQVRLVNLIEVKALRGSGTKDDPVRSVTQYYSFDGELVAEKDPITRMDETEE